MERRPFANILVFSLIFFSLLLLQNWLWPVPQQPQQNPANVQNEVVGEQTGEQTDQPATKPTSDNATTPLDSDVKSGQGNTNSDATQIAQDPAAQDPAGQKVENDTDTNIANPETAPNQTPPAVPEQLITLGSLNADANDRYLVTFSTRGAAIRRVELNARDPKGNYRYRDLHHFGGYLGKLELVEDDMGLRARVVGKGTPAERAGMRAGDLIRSIDAVPVVSSVDFRNSLEKTKEGQTIAIQVSRDENGAATTVDLQAELTDQPLELLQPERGTLSPNSNSPDSFRFSLYKSNSMEWIEIDPKMLKGDWVVREGLLERPNDADNGQATVEFSYELPTDVLEKLGLVGPLKVVKRYWLPKLTDSNRLLHSDRSFHINLELVVENSATAAQTVGFQLIGPTGTPTEGWWYQNKIHGRSTAFGYIAGARDVVGKTEGGGYVFWGGPEIISNTLKPQPIFQSIVDKNSPDLARKRLYYAGVDTQYFNVALLPAPRDDGTPATYECYSAIAGIISSEIPSGARLQRLVDCSFYLFDEIEVPGAGSWRQHFQIFAGPKEAPLLNVYGLEDNRTFGWFASFSQILCWLLTFFYNITFQFSYGLAIIMLTVLVRVLMIPISRKVALNAQMMQLLAPEMKKIADKYKDDMEKRAIAQRELFRRHRYNPFGGCLLMFLQLPIFIGLYRGLSVDIALRDQPLIPGMRWCSNLAAPDQLFYWKDWMPSFLADETGWMGPWFNLLPLATIALFLIQQKMFTPPPTDEQQALAQKMMSYMMIFLGVMFFKVPAGLCIYFITSSIWGILERQLLPKPKLATDALKSIDDLVIPSTASASKNPPAAPAKGMAGFMERLRDAVEQNKKSKSKPVDSETQRRLERERQKKKRDQGY